MECMTISTVRRWFLPSLTIVIVFFGILLLFAFYATSSNQISTSLITPTPKESIVARVTPQAVPVLAQTRFEGIKKDGTKWETTLIASSQDSEWINQKPIGVTSSFDSKSRNILVSWSKNPADQTNTYMWLVGYFTQPFDPAEKFREENTASIYWSGIRNPDNTSLGGSGTITVPLTNTPQSGSVYFFLYKRTKSPEGIYTDLLYGLGDSPGRPFVQYL